jgi:hypothetical protein
VPEANDQLRLRAEELTKKTKALLESRRAAQQVIERPRHHLEIMALYGRAVSLYDAIAILLKRDHPGEAFMLGRGLFSESLRLRHLADATEAGRIALITGWIVDSVTALEGVQRGIEKRQTGPADPVLLRKIAEIKRRARAYMHRKNVKSEKTFPKENDMAVKQGRQDELGDYAYSHEFVHGGYTSLVLRINERQREDEAVMVIALTTQDPTVLAGGAVTAAKSMLLAHRAAGEILGWDDEETVVALLDVAEKLGEDAQEAS